jgi:hypothetical protein
VPEPVTPWKRTNSEVAIASSMGSTSIGASAAMLVPAWSSVADGIGNYPMGATIMRTDRPC